MHLEDLQAIRRDLHIHAEPAWREFYTTSAIVDTLEEIGVDELYVGSDALEVDHRLNVPDQAVIDPWKERARHEGARTEVVEDGIPGAVAVLHQGDGPVVALRADIDALPSIHESDADAHQPAAEGFRSIHDDVMHACGHDGHATIALGVLARIKESDFSGTFKVFFQPAEEVGGGGKPMAESPHIEDVDYLFSAHLGLNHGTGEVVAAVDNPFSWATGKAVFHGQVAHGSGEPNKGKNAAQALATAIQNIYAIPRHADGPTRVNVGRFEGGSLTNNIPETATVEFEIRGKDDALLAYMDDEVRRMFEASAAMHDCTVDVQIDHAAPGYRMDDELSTLVKAAAEETPSVHTVVDTDQFGASEDVTHLMQVVKANGGTATYSCIGTDHPTPHHTPTFDIDEQSLEIGVDVLATAIVRASLDQP